jgi:hypothetical protein
MRSVHLLLLLAIASGCDAAPTSRAGAGPVDAAPTPSAAAQERHFGAAFSLGASEPLGAALVRIDAAAAAARASADAGSDVPVESCAKAGSGEDGTKVRVTGKVTAVCPKSGCWMTIEDGGKTARVFTREHGFSLPRDAVGRRADVEGLLRSRTLSQQMLVHLERERGGDPATVAGPSREYLITATAVTLE